jgi:hypothetical protein
MHSPHRGQAPARVKTLGLLSFSLALPLLTFTCNPTEIAEERFGSALQSCYEYPLAVDAGASPQTAFNDELVRRPGCPDPYAVGGAAGMGGSGGAAPGGSGGQSSGMGGGAAGSGNSMTGSGGSSNPSAGGAGGGTGMQTGGAAGTAPMMPSGGAAGDGAGPVVPVDPFPVSEECNDVVRDLFTGPVTRSQGGCQDPEFGDCHNPDQEPSGSLLRGHQPNLMSSSVESLLVGGFNAERDACNRVWIEPGATEVTPSTSFLWERVTTDSTSEKSCEAPMPLNYEGGRLSEGTLECLKTWILHAAHNN